MGRGGEGGGWSIGEKWRSFSASPLISRFFLQFFDFFLSIFRFLPDFSISLSISLVFLRGEGGEISPEKICREGEIFCFHFIFFNLSGEAETFCDRVGAFFHSLSTLSGGRRVTLEGKAGKRGGEG